MSLLQASVFAFRHDSQTGWLFRNVSFELSPGDRVALVGPNGSGKTSLLRILTGELEPVSGTLVRRSDLRVAYVRQEVTAPAGGWIWRLRSTRSWSAVTPVTALTASVRAANRGWCNLASWHERRLDLLTLQDEQKQSKR